MPNIKISDLAPATLPLDLPNSFFEVQTFEAGVEVSRKISAEALTGRVDSVNSGVNITVDNTDSANPIVNLNGAILAVSVNGVTLDDAGAVTNFLNETGAYSVPPGAATNPAGADEEIQFNDNGAFGADPFFKWDQSQTSLLIDARNATGFDGAIEVTRMQEGCSGLRLHSVNGNTTFHDIWRDFDPNAESSFRLQVDSTAGVRLLAFIDDPDDTFIEMDAFGADIGRIRFGGHDTFERVFMDFNNDIFSIRNSMTLYLEEIAVANSDITAEGQIWAGTDQSLNFTDSAGANTILTAVPAVEQLVDPSANVAFIALGLGIVAMRSVGNLEAEDRSIEWQHQDGTTQFSIGSEFFTDMILRNHITGRHVIINVGVGPGNRIRIHCDGDQTTGGVTLYAGSSGLGRLATANEGVRIQNGTLFLAEQAAQEADDPGFGQLFVDSADDSLHYITEAGVDTNLLAGIGGSITDNQIAVGAAVANDIEGSSQLIFAGGDLALTADEAGMLFGAGADAKLFYSNSLDVFRIDLLAATDFILRLNSGSDNAIVASQGGDTTLYGNGIAGIGAQDRTAAGALTGGVVIDSVANPFPVGFNVIPGRTITTNQTVTDDFIGRLWEKTAGGAITITLDDDSDIPIGATIMVANIDTEAMSIDEGAGVTLNWFDGSTAGGATGNRTLASGGIVTIRKRLNTLWQIWGNGLS